MAKFMGTFEMGEEIAAQHRAQAARDDADPAYQAALKAKREREEAARGRTTLTEEEAAAEWAALEEEDENDA
ncbi:hypothetical protein UFOVP1413_22 [uncultured Caudovirales phage]|uniref:Uncharacterized protein n=1 Tax=uncultured Caudovirales phage TaxID=2100421 RepID=A0A6J5PBT1_9CAUD|nr:hypothetical protein UFOVP893_17 [uncultured Caudovirales phage]CAB4210484.1 hypothetical protein UFOVP1413_22 [uncultured Caudovirales phage]